MCGGPRPTQGIPDGVAEGLRFWVISLFYINSPLLPIARDIVHWVYGVRGFGLGFFHVACLRKECLKTPLFILGHPYLNLKTLTLRRCKNFRMLPVPKHPVLLKSIAEL